MHEPTHNIREIEELVINWHIIEKCNFRCQFCYGKWDKPDEETEVWKNHSGSRRLLEALQRMSDPNSLTSPLRSQLRWQSSRLSIAGGEPTLLGERLVSILADARALGLGSSLITNGSRADVITRAAQHIGIVAISIDSIDPRTNAVIGRNSSNGHSVSLDDVVALVRGVRTIRPGIIVKINTVVNGANAEEDLSKLIRATNPDRWKIMRVLPIVTDKLSIGHDVFRRFIDRHSGFQSLITAEDNSDMVESYIMVDPYGRFFQNASGHAGYRYSRSILEVGAEVAFREINFSPAKFVARYPSGMRRTDSQ
jgi:radical S-adenosyl methionine domain-containing protein 2